jgi:hypothetical protein
VQHAEQSAANAEAVPDLRVAVNRDADPFLGRHDIPAVNVNQRQVGLNRALAEAVGESQPPDLTRHGLHRPEVDTGQIAHDLRPRGSLQG